VVVRKATVFHFTELEYDVNEEECPLVELAIRNASIQGARSGARVEVGGQVR
jgi:hypothetical protein